MRISRIVVNLLAVLALWLTAPGAALAQGVMTNGENHTGTIAISGEIDQWTFSATQGDAIVLSLAEVVRVPDSNFSPWIRLYGPGGAQIGGDNFYGALVAQIAVTASLTGTYTVRVAAGYPGYTSVGDYRLILARVPGQPVVPGGDQGGPMTNGVNHVGRIEVGDLDQWTFTANAGDNVVVSIGEIPVEPVVPDPNFSPWIRLYGPSGAQIGGDSFYGTLTAQIAHTVQVGGVYTVVASAGYPYYPATGDYHLVLAQVPGTPVVEEGDDGGRLTNGINHDARIEIGDLDQWTFTANQGDSLVLSIGELQVGPGVPDPNFAPWMRLYGPTGAQIGGDNFYGALAAQMATTAPLSGTYTVLVAAGYPYYAATGDYRLILARVPERPVVKADDTDLDGPMTNGRNHVGRIELGDLDQWTFTAAQGDRLVVSIGEIAVGPGVPDPNFSPWIRLYGPTGAQIGGDNVYGSAVAQLATSAPLSGTYTVLVAAGYPYYPATGDYHLVLAQVPGTPLTDAGDHGGRMTNGANHDGRIEVGDLDQWTFTATQGDHLVLGIGEIGVGPGVPDPNFSPWIRLYGPTGAQIGGDNIYGSAVAQLATSAPLSGTYTVLVAAGYPYYPATGDYRLILAQMPGSPVVDAGDQGGPMAAATDYPGRIELGDLDQWTFSANQGSALTVTIAEIPVGPGVPDPNFSPWIRLYGPTGAQIGGDFFYGASGAQILTTAPLTGTYSVVVSAGYPYYPAAGDYLLRVLGAAAPPTPPISSDDAYATPQGRALVVAAPGVLANDSLAGGGTVALVSGPARGTLTLNADGSFTYVPTGNSGGVDAFTYRAANASGPGNAATVRITVGETTPGAPTGLSAALIAGNEVTVRWLPPADTAAPTGYVLEAGLMPGEVLATVATGSAVPVFTFPAPTGVFWVRVRAIVEGELSPPSNDIRVHANVEAPPSAPTNLLGAVDGSAVALAWRNTFGGGAPTGLIVDVAGPVTGSVAVALDERFTFAEVPAGTYTFTVRATNAGGVSAASNPVTLTFPMECSGAPQPPEHVLAQAVGNSVQVLWDPPSGGPAATSYLLTATGTVSGTMPSTSRMLRRDAAPGTYTLTVIAVNACGVSAPTAPVTVVVP